MENIGEALSYYLKHMQEGKVLLTPWILFCFKFQFN